MAAYRRVNDGYRRLTAKNRDQLRNPMYARQSSTGCLYFFTIHVGVSRRFGCPVRHVTQSSVSRAARTQVYCR